MTDSLSAHRYYLPPGQIVFALSFDPETNEFSLAPIDEVAPFVEEKSDFLDRLSGLRIRIDDETWAYYANKVGEVITAGKKELISIEIASLAEALSTTVLE